MGRWVKQGKRQMVLKEEFVHSIIPMEHFTTKTVPGAGHTAGSKTQNPPFKELKCRQSQITDRQKNSQVDGWMDGCYD
jgi:hypothetical protein